MNDTRSRQARFVFLLAGTLLALGPAAALAQQPVGQLFFLNSVTDAVGVSHIDRQGQWHSTYQSPSSAGFTPSSGYTQVIDTANGFLVYELISGSAQIVRITHDGKTSKGGKYYFSPFWKHIVGSGTFLFFYNPWDGSAAIGHITPDGTFVQTQGWWPYSFSAWTDVVTTDNNLVFYHRDSGVMAVGHIRFNGIWVQTDVFHMILGCTSVITSGQYVLCYNGSTGFLQVMDIDPNGYALPKDVAQVGGGYDLVVRHGRDIVFYSKADAGLQVGHVGDGGLYAATYSTRLYMDEFHPFIDATDVVSTGDALLICQQQSGKSLIATIDRDGQFHETEWRTLADQWTDIVATAAR